MLGLIDWFFEGQTVGRIVEKLDLAVVPKNLKTRSLFDLLKVDFVVKESMAAAEGAKVKFAGNLGPFPSFEPLAAVEIFNHQRNGVDSPGHRDFARDNVDVNTSGFENTFDLPHSSSQVRQVFQHMGSNDDIGRAIR